jgi:hypothetical protein
MLPFSLFCLLFLCSSCHQLVVSLLLGFIHHYFISF